MQGSVRPGNGNERLLRTSNARTKRFSLSFGNTIKIRNVYRFEVWKSKRFNKSLPVESTSWKRRIRIFTLKYKLFNQIYVNLRLYFLVGSSASRARLSQGVAKRAGNKVSRRDAQIGRGATKKLSVTRED